MAANNALFITLCVIGGIIYLLLLVGSFYFYVFTIHPDQKYLSKTTKSIFKKLNIVVIPFIYSILGSHLFLTSFNYLLEKSFSADTETIMLIYNICYIACLIICSFASYGILISIFSTIVIGFAGYYFGLGGYRMTGTVVSQDISLALSNL